VASVVGGLVLAKSALPQDLMFFVGSLVISNLAFVYLGRSQPDAFLLITVVWCVPCSPTLRRGRAHVLHDEADFARAVPDRALRLRHWDHGALQFLRWLLQRQARGCARLPDLLHRGAFLRDSGLLAAWFAPFVHSMGEETKADIGQKCDEETLVRSASCCAAL